MNSIVSALRFFFTHTIDRDVHFTITIGFGVDGQF